MVFDGGKLQMKTGVEEDC